MADFLSKPPGFYLLIAVMIASTTLIPLGLTAIVTYGLSVAAIFITGVVLIQGYRDTTAIHAKLDEIVLSLNNARNEVVGLEHSDPKEIKKAVQKKEREALKAKEK